MVPMCVCACTREHSLLSLLKKVTQRTWHKKDHRDPKQDLFLRSRNFLGGDGDDEFLSKSWFDDLFTSLSYNV